MIAIVSIKIHPRIVTADCSMLKKDLIIFGRFESFGMVSVLAPLQILVLNCVCLQQWPNF